MTLLETPPPPAPPAQVATPAPGAPAPGAGARAVALGRIAGSMSTVLAIMLLVFVAEMVLVGPITHNRAQAVLYKEFRSQLANGVAPTGQLGAVKKDQGTYSVDAKKLVPLGAPVALLDIPSIDLRQIVSQGTTSKVLMSGPGHRRDSPMPGQAGTVLIMARQATYGGPFGDIDELKVGDEIALGTGQLNSAGKSGFLYKVTGIRHAGDPAPVPDPTKARLTLITGDGTPYLPSDVVRVDAELAPGLTPVPSSAGPINVTNLPESETAMAADTSALLPLLLWSQALLLLAVALTWVRSVWGRWQSWMVCVPVFGVVGFKVAGLIAQLLPNLI